MLLTLISCRLKTIILIVFCFSIQGCEESTMPDENKQETKIYGRSYSAIDNAIKINNEYVKNVYQINSDERGKFTIYSEVENNAQPNLKLLDITTQNVMQLTNSTSIEFDPVVNSNGEFAYALHDYSVAISKIYLNKQIIELPAGLYKSLAINDRKLAFNKVDSIEDRNTLYIYDLVNDEYVQLELPLVTATIAFTSLDKLIIEGLGIENNQNMVISVDTENMVIDVVSPAKNGESCFLTSYGWGERAQVDCLNNTTDRDKIFLHMAMREIQTKDPLLALACSNNELGRISWNVSYRMLTLLEIATNTKLKTIVTNEYNYPVSEIVTNAIDCLINNVNPSNSNEHLLWATTKYSIDKKSKLSLLVDDSAILYPLVKAANTGILSVEQVNRITELVESYYDFHESNYDQKLQMYRFGKGIPFWSDGIVLPWNMSNHFGLVLIEMFKLTKDDKYHRRVSEIAAAFRNEWIFNSDNSVKWHYWPNLFYNGWDLNDNLSENTPSFSAFTDVLFEDIAHSGLNVLFANEYYKAFSDDTFSLSDIDSFKLTINAIEYNGLYSAFMSGDIEYLPPSRRFIPSFGWVDYIEPEKLINGHPNYYPIFEGGFEYDYIRILAN